MVSAYRALATCSLRIHMYDTQSIPGCLVDYLPFQLVITPGVQSGVVVSTLTVAPMVEASYSCNLFQYNTQMVPCSVAHQFFRGVVKYPLGPVFSMRPYLPAIRLIRLSSRLNRAIVCREADFTMVILERSWNRMLPRESAAVILFRFLSMPIIPLHCTIGVCFEYAMATVSTARVTERSLIPGSERTSSVVVQGDCESSWETE